MSEVLTIREARHDDVPALTALINRAYRGESSRAGWTTEADLLAGLRIDERGLESILGDPDSLILSAWEKERLFASIQTHREGECVHFGLLAVEPSLQGKGIGKKLLAWAEAEVQNRWKVSCGVMEVIGLREELITFYERLGYQRTGKKDPFPISTLWTPKVSGLEFVELRKSLP